MPTAAPVPQPCAARGAGRGVEGESPRTPARSPPPEQDDEARDPAWDPEDAAWGSDGELEGLAPLEVEFDTEPQPHLDGVRVVQPSGLMFDQLKVVFMHPVYCTGGDMKYSR